VENRLQYFAAADDQIRFERFLPVLAVMRGVFVSAAFDESTEPCSGNRPSTRPRPERCADRARRLYKAELEVLESHLLIGEFRTQIRVARHVADPSSDAFDRERQPLNIRRRRVR
jgi:hypothetical protein